VTGATPSSTAHDWTGSDAVYVAAYRELMFDTPLGPWLFDGATGTADAEPTRRCALVTVVGVGRGGW
jgi:hypothetical protein